MDLGVSPRTLRRRLQNEGTSFQTLLDDVRFSLAKGHLYRGEIAVAELAFVLGFSDTSAFYRAFKRWTGTTPQRSAQSQRDARSFARSRSPS